MNLVCPTYVGMNRTFFCIASNGGGMPHVCGDEPIVRYHEALIYMYAPRMWG